MFWNFVVGAARTCEGGTLLTVTENGYGKRTPLEEYLRSGGEEEENSETEPDRQPQKRGGMGLKNYNITDKTGKVAAIKVVRDEDDVMIISDDGTIIRMAASDINVYGRATQGVILMRLQEGVRVISLARTEREEECDSCCQEDTGKPEDPSAEGGEDRPQA